MLNVEFQRAAGVVGELSPATDRIAVQVIVDKELVPAIDRHRPERADRRRQTGREMQDIALGGIERLSLAVDERAGLRAFALQRWTSAGCLLWGGMHPFGYRTTCRRRSARKPSIIAPPPVNSEAAWSRQVELPGCFGETETLGDQGGASQSHDARVRERCTWWGAGAPHPTLADTMATPAF